MPTPTIIETDLREILAEMNKKLDTMSADINRKLEVLFGEVNQVQVRLAVIVQGDKI